MATPTETARERGKKVPLIAGALVLVIGGAGVVIARKREASTGAEGLARAEPHAPGVIALEPYVLNLADDEGGRYLRCTLRIVLDRDDAARSWNTDPLLQTRVRDRVFFVLAARSADELAAPDGREKLRDKIKTTVEPLFEEARVLEVYFAEFLLQ